MKQRVDEWNQAYQKRQANKQTREDGKLPGWSGGAPLDSADNAMTAQNKGAHWKLITNIDDDGQPACRNGERKKPIWRTTVEYSRGNSGIKLTYLGNSDTSHQDSSKSKAPRLPCA